MTQQTFHTTNSQGLGKAGLGGKLTH